MRSVLLGCASLLLIGCIKSAAPLGVLTSDRPGFSDSQGIVPKGRLQLESGYTYSDLGQGSYQSIGELLIRSGIARKLELRMHLNSYALSNQNSNRSDGLEDSRVGIKYLVSPISKSYQPALSVIASSSIPTGGNEFGQETMIPEAKLIVFWSGSSPLSVTANAGLNWGRPNERDGFGFATTALWVTVNPSLSGFAEFYFTARTARTTVESRQIDAGMTWLLTRKTQLDLRLGASVKTDSPGSFVGAGFVTRW